MDRFKSILVAASPGHLEPSTLRAAVKLADVNNAHLTVLGVLEPLPRWRRTVKVEGRVIDVQELVLRDRSERVRRFIDFAGARPDVVVETRTGKPLVEVIRYVLSHGCELVVVGEPEPPTGDPAGVGAGVMQLLRKCPVPVCVMRPTRIGTRRVLALVDPDPTDPVRDRLNDLVLELASSMTRREGGELHVAHAWHLEGQATPAPDSYVSGPSTEIGMIGQAVADEHQTQLDALMQRHGISQVGGCVHLVEGEPGRVLPELAERLDISLMVMGTVGRTDLSGLFMGNTAETVLRSVDCSVLALKPKGFVSPVLLDSDSGKAGQ